MTEPPSDVPTTFDDDSFASRCQAALRAAQERGASVVLWQFDLGPSYLGRTVADRRRVRQRVRELVLATHCQTTPTELVVSTLCHRCGDPHHGKPSLLAPVTDINFSTSSTGRQLVIAVAKATIGADVAELDQLALIDLPHIDAVTGSALSEITDGLPTHLAHLAWPVFEALGKLVGAGVVATRDEIVAALGTARVGFFFPTPATVACFAVAMDAPVAVGIRGALSGDALTLHPVALLSDASI